MNTMDLLQRHRQVMPEWLVLYYSEPLQIVRGEGRHVWDSHGKQYLDFFGGILTTLTGHGIPEIQEAVARQNADLLHSSTLYLMEPMVELAELIASLSGIDDARVFFTTSGTEATDTALLLCCQNRSSNQVLAVRNSYHGRSFTAQSITGNRSWSATSLSGLSVNFVNATKRWEAPFGCFSDEEFLAACVADLKDIIMTATSGDVACFIAEPIQGVGGFTAPPDGLFAMFKEVLDEHGILYITDEVQTGWGRTGDNFWGYQAHNITPNVLSFAKGVANGLPLGGVVANAELMNSLGANSLSTFGGNPLACAGALANIKYLLEHDLQSNSQKMGQRLAEGLSDIAGGYSWLGDVRGKGLMLALEALTSDGNAHCPDTANAFHEETRERGLLVGKGGLYGNVLRISPPLTTTANEIDESLNIFADSAKAVAQAKRK